MKTKILALAISSVLFPVASVLADGNSIETTVEGSRNGSELNQTGSDNSITIQQVNGEEAGALGTSADNQISVTQDDGNSANVIQYDTRKAEAVINQNSWMQFSGSGMASGGGNSASIVQLFGSSAYASIEQNGNGNEASVVQVEKASTNITQNGSSNFVDVSQNGDDTYATVTQTGWSGDGYNNSATIEQVSAPGVTSVVADVFQSGSGNTANIQQFAISSVIASALIDQQGSDNTATINQDIGTPGTDISAAIYQGGRGDTATINQTGESNNQTIYQSWNPAP